MQSKTVLGARSGEIVFYISDELFFQLVFISGMQTAQIGTELFLHGDELEAFDDGVVLLHQ